MTKPAGNDVLWYSFLYGLMYIAFFIWIIALGGLMHIAIDEYFPQPATRFPSSATFSGVNVFVSMLLVSFPIFAVLAYLIQKNVQRKPHIRTIAGRKTIMVSLAALAFLVMLGNLILLLTNFFTTPFSLNFYAHTIGTILFALAVFLFQVLDIRQTSKLHD